MSTALRGDRESHLCITQPPKPLLFAARSVSYTARMVLAQPDRGGLQAATFHTLRTYLTPLNKLLKDWLRSFPNVGPLPCILQETVDWLKDLKDKDKAKESCLVRR